MKLYHATPEKNLANIMEKGLLPSFDGLYMTDDLRAARWFANLQEQTGSTEVVGEKLVWFENPRSVVLEIDSEDLTQDRLGRNHEMLCDILETTDFYYYYGTVEPSSLKIVEEALLKSL